jgi:Protein of unknown function (DUF3016)
MKTLIRQLAFAAVCLLSAGSALAGVTVNYVEPGKYADMPFEPWERDDVLKGLTEHFQKLGKQLPPNQDLSVEVLDIDLAGRVHPGMRSGRDIRILRGGADWPHMRLHYALQAGGSTIASGDAELSDMMYLERLNRYSDGESLRFEKRMIDDWFNKTILHKP